MLFNGWQVTPAGARSRCRGIFRYGWFSARRTLPARAHGGYTSRPGCDRRGQQEADSNFGIHQDFAGLCISANGRTVYASGASGEHSVGFAPVLGLPLEGRTGKAFAVGIEG